MEQVLDLYAMPYDPAEPLIAMDESSIQLLADLLDPLPMTPDGRHPRRRVDDQYERRGVRALFMFVDPLGGWRRVTSSAHRTRADWAREIKRLLDEDYPHARRVHLVCDNLNIHDVASLYETFAPDEAHRLARRLQIHYTPKHGSWLNVAEIELSVLQHQCLGDRRLGDPATLDAELGAWNAARNAERAKIQWRFTTADARIRLRYLYPPI
jgi:hypothetical protein